MTAANVNPLPAGMRDFLPPHAKRQSQVGGSIMKVLELHGYERVWLPTFEYARVLERRGSTRDAAYRFVEPETGEIVALRSDMTPQVARVVSTRFREAATPVRLSYQGSVLRRRAERARLESQVVQAGAELIGRGGVDGDLEVIEVMCAAVRATQLDDFALDVGHVGVARALLAEVPQPDREAMREALEAKDVAVLEQRARLAGVADATRRALVALPDLHGGIEVWPRVTALLKDTPAAPCVAELQALCERLVNVAPRVVVDLGETRDLTYYTGVVFQVLAHGPGEPVASGGRYDQLLPRFGMAQCAAGFAIELNNLCWALADAGRTWPTLPRVVAGPEVSPSLLVRLRARGVACCVSEEPERYAREWEGAWVLSGRRLSLPGGPTAELHGDEATICSAIESTLASPGSV